MDRKKIILGKEQVETLLEKFLSFGCSITKEEIEEALNFVESMHLPIIKSEAKNYNQAVDEWQNADPGSEEEKAAIIRGIMIAPKDNDPVCSYIDFYEYANVLDYKDAKRLAIRELARLLFPNESRSLKNKNPSL